MESKSYGLRLLSAIVVLSLLTTHLGLWMVLQPLIAQADAVESQRRLDLGPDFQAGLLLMAGGALVALFSFLTWFWRAYSNLWALDATGGLPSWSTTWSVVAWLVPGVNLVLPPFLAHAIWRSSRAWDRGLPGGRGQPGGLFVPCLWLLVLASQGASAQFSETAYGIRTWAPITFWSSLGSAIGWSIFILVVTKNQEARRLSLLGPSAPAPASALSPVIVPRAPEVPGWRPSKWVWVAAGVVIATPGLLVLGYLLLRGGPSAPIVGPIVVAGPPPTVESTSAPLPTSTAKAIQAQVTALPATIWGGPPSPTWREPGVRIEGGFAGVYVDARQLVVARERSLLVHEDGSSAPRQCDLAGRIRDLAVSPPDLALVSFEGDPKIEVIDLRRMESIGSCTGPGPGAALATDPHQPGTVFAFGVDPRTGNASLAQIEARSAKVVGTRPLSDTYQGGYRLSSSGRLLYLASEKWRFGLSLDPATGAILGSSHSDWAEPHPNGELVFSNHGIIRADLLTPVRELRGLPRLAGTLPDGTLLTYTGGDSQLVYRDPETLEELQREPVGRQVRSGNPHWADRLVLLPGTTRVVSVPDFGSGQPYAVAYRDLPAREAPALRLAVVPPSLAHPLETWELPLEFMGVAAKDLQVRVSGPEGVEFDRSRGVLRWRPTLSQVGARLVVFTVEAPGVSPQTVRVGVRVEHRLVELLGTRSLMRLSESAVAWFAFDVSRTTTLRVVDFATNSWSSQSFTGRTELLVSAPGRLCYPTGRQELVVLDLPSLQPSSTIFLPPQTETWSSPEEAVLHPSGDVTWVTRRAEGVPAVCRLSLPSGELRVVEVRGYRHPTSAIPGLVWLNDSQFRLGDAPYEWGADRVRPLEPAEAAPPPPPPATGGLLVSQDGSFRVEVEPLNEDLAVRFRSVPDGRELATHTYRGVHLGYPVKERVVLLSALDALLVPLHGPNGDKTQFALLRYDRSTWAQPGR